jgi:3-isopropylmalate/(R)-2-methylmalate dehydratase large subunit
MSQPRTLFDKLWESHAIALPGEGGAGGERPSLLWIDRHFIHEGSHHAFAKLAERGNRVGRPDLTFAVTDHYVPVRAGAKPASADIGRMIARLERNSAQHGIALFGVGDPRQGIVHVVGPEEGLTLPGLTIVCGDSHTSTHGAFGAYAFGIGASEVAHVLATQTLRQRRPKQMRITVEGRLPPGVAAKDVILSIIARIGADGAVGHAIEYTGSTIRGLTMEGRMTICNMSNECGARCGMVAPDEVTFGWIEGRPYAPAGGDFDQAVEVWRRLASDAGAAVDREVTLAADEIAPVVTWGNSPEDALPITGCVPDPASIGDVEKARSVAAAIDYMGLVPGRPLDGIAVDRVFIGSCTNARIEDLRAAAAVLAGRRARVPGLISPGSMQIKHQAEQEGLDRIFRDAGLEWAGAGCSMCVAMNGDVVPPGERCASTTNRNFRGRQGPASRTHLMSPAMVAAAAVAGCLTDVRPLLEGRPVMEHHA